MTQGDGAACWAQHRGAGGVETLEHLRGGEGGQRIGDWRVQRQAALLDQLHGCERGERLGHGGDPEHRVQRHRRLAGEIAQAERALVDCRLGGGGQCDEAGHCLRGLCVAQGTVDTALDGHELWPFGDDGPNCDSGREEAEAAAGFRQAIERPNGRRRAALLRSAPPNGSARVGSVHGVRVAGGADGNIHLIPGRVANILQPGNIDGFGLQEISLPPFRLNRPRKFGMMAARHRRGAGRLRVDRAGVGKRAHAGDGWRGFLAG